MRYKPNTSTTKTFQISSLLLLSALIASAEVRSNSYTTQTWFSSNKATNYPLVALDRHVTFRVKAPSASQVSLLFGEWNVKPQPMTRDTQGNWSLTIGPVEPGFYQYTFSIDGMRAVDLGNPGIKTGLAVDASVLDVPGEPPRFDQVQNVPHGAIHYLQYTSTPLQRNRGLCVYAPPGYEARGKQKYPVLYLRHGGGDNENSWSRDGRAGVILDNLIAQGKAVPMLVVMTDGMVDGSWGASSSPEGMKLLEAELLQDVVPLIERSYCVEARAESRAIAGLSMGGGQAFVIGLNHLDQFSWVGEFSSGLLSDYQFKLDQQVPAMTDVPGVNRRLRLLWLACGTLDPRYVGHLNLADLLKDRGVKAEFHEMAGGHEWKVWRCQLRDFAQRLFKP